MVRVQEKGGGVSEETLDQIVERLQKERLATGKSFFLSRPDPLRDGDCRECGGMGEIEVHATLFECRACEGTGREDFEPKQEESNQWKQAS